jgi:hypothetical protein
MSGFSFEMPQKENLLEQLTLIPTGTHLFEISYTDYIKNDPYEKDYVLIELMFIEEGIYFGKTLKKKYKINSLEEKTKLKNIKEFCEFCEFMLGANEKDVIGIEHLRSLIGKQVLAKVGQWKKDERSNNINVVYALMPYNAEKNDSFQFDIETGIQAPQKVPETTQILNDEVPF